MKRYGFVILMLFVAMTPFAVSSGASDAKKTSQPKKSGKSSSTPVQTQRSQLTDAKQKLKTAQKEVAAAQSRLEKAESRRKNAAKALQETQEKLEARFDESTGLTKTRETFRKIQEDLDRVSAPILEKVRQKPEYQQAVEDADAAKTQLRALLKDETLDSMERQQRSKTLNGTAMAPAKMEQAALEAVPRIQALRRRLEKSQAAVAAARKRRDAAVNRDQANREAEKKFEQAKREVAKVEAELARKQKATAVAGAKTGREQQDLLQATQRQQLKPKRVGSSKKKKKKRRGR